MCQDPKLRGPAIVGKRSVILALFLTIVGFSTPGLSLTFGRYHSFEEVNNWLRKIDQKYRSTVTHQHLGYSLQGRAIGMVIISNGAYENKPAMYVNATHHGNERSSTEASLGLIDYLLTHLDDPKVERLLNSYAIYVQPIVNPDGFQTGSRYDARGGDLNRQYPIVTEDSQMTAAKPPMPAVNLVKTLVDNRQFRAAVALHSGTEAILWPFGSSRKKPRHQDVFYTLAKLTAQAMGFSRFQQSHLDYPTKGEFIDYAYAKHGTLAVTMEVSQRTTPPTQHLVAILRRSVAGLMTYLLGIQDFDSGYLAIEPSPTARPK